MVGNHQELYLVGSRGGEPVAIWKYEVGTDALSCVVSNPQPAFKFGKAVVPVAETMTNYDGRVFSYRLWAPPNLSSGKKYPLLIGQIGSRWLDYPALLANCGAYVLSVEHDFRKGDWGESVPLVCEYLKNRRKIDAGQVFLFGGSGETFYVSALLEDRPELWRGAILFSPVAFPSVNKLGSARLLFDCGGEDRSTARAIAYGDEAARAGVAVTVVVHENAGHVYRSVGALRARNEALVKFLFGR